MKSIYKNLSIIAACMLSLGACDDVMDTHKAFIEGGEIIYAPKPDTIYFVSGRNRIELNYRISEAPNVTSINVYWNNKKDSLIVPLELTSGTEEGKVDITGLEEQSYTFTVQLEDLYGHKSLALSGVGTSYGDNYQNSLSNRRIKKMDLTDEGGIIEWNVAQEGLVRTEVKYTDLSGTDMLLSLDATENTLICPNVATGSGVELRSAFIPEEECVDTFYTAWESSIDMELTFPHEYEMEEVDRQQSGWQLLYYSNTDPGEGKPEYILDGDMGSYWHSNYQDGQQEPYPFTFVIDMKKDLLIGKLGAASRENNWYTRGISYYITEDDVYAGNPDSNNWIYLGDVELPQANGMQWDDVEMDVLENQIKGRYLKVVLTSGYQASHLGAIAEINVQKVTSIDGNPIE